MKLFRSDRSYLAILLTFSYICGCSMPQSSRLSSTTVAKSIKNPFGSNRESKAPTTIENPFQTKPTPQTQLVSSSQQTSQSGEVPPFDPATMMLIETEFKDASPEDRKKWFEELKRVPPDMVPRLLRIRRMAQQESESESSMSSNQLVAKTSPAEDYAPAENHLSSLSPWQQPAETRTAPDPSGSPIQSAALPKQTQHLEHHRNSNSPENATQLTSHKLTSPPPMNEPSQNSMPNTAVASTENNLEDQYQDALTHLISLAEQRAFQMKPDSNVSAQSPYTQQHVYLRMLYLMDSRQERALEAIPNLTSNEQEYWQQMFWGLANYLDTINIPLPADRATLAVAQFRDASQSLSSQANLELRNSAFCQQIDGFGKFQRFPRDEFRPGQPVLIYSEVRNFATENTSDGEFRAALKSTIEIHKAGDQGGLVIREELPTTEDLCQSRRHDFYHSYMIHIPERATMGPHVLKLVVEDELGNKVATQSMNFLVN